MSPWLSLQHRDDNTCSGEPVAVADDVGIE